MRQAQGGQLWAEQGLGPDGLTAGTSAQGRRLRRTFGRGEGHRGEGHRGGGHTALRRGRDARIGGRYVLGDVLGRGGMGTVYRAFDTHTGQQVALKLLAGAPGGDERRSHNEALALQQLDHPNLVRLLDVGREGEELYLVMDLLAGRTLFSRLREGPLSLEEAARLGRDVAAALAYVHDHDIVHRDVKPANIVMGDDGAARLTDFGIALLSSSPALTATGVTVGTPAYLAPEQAEGHRAGPPADVYALGLVLIESLTGSPVFSGTPGEMMAARLWLDPPLPAGLDEGWRDLLATMTARAPAQRSSAAAVAAYLAYRAGVAATAAALPEAAAALSAADLPPAALPAAADRPSAAELRSPRRGTSAPITRPTPAGLAETVADRRRPGRKTLALSMAGVAAAAATAVMLPNLVESGAARAPTSSAPPTSAPTTATHQRSATPPSDSTQALTPPTTARSTAASTTASTTTTSPAAGGSSSHKPSTSSTPTTGASPGPLTALPAPAHARTVSAGTKATTVPGPWPGVPNGQPTSAGYTGAAAHWPGGHDQAGPGHEPGGPGHDQGGAGVGGPGHDPAGPGQNWDSPGHKWNSPGHNWGTAGAGDGHGYGHQGRSGQGGNGPDTAPPAAVR